VRQRRSRFVAASSATMLDRKRTSVITARGLLAVAAFCPKGQVAVDMVGPLEPAEVPFFATSVPPPIHRRRMVNCKSACFHGNPPAVLVVADLVAPPGGHLGRCWSGTAVSPAHHVGFMQIVAPDHIRLRVFERAPRDSGLRQRPARGWRGRLGAVVAERPGRIPGGE